MIRIGFWKWPLVFVLALTGLASAYRLGGPPIHYYQSDAILGTLNPRNRLADLKHFRSPEFLCEIAVALGWVKPNTLETPSITLLDKLARTLTWEPEGLDRVRVRGIGKDPAGIMWLVNTTAKTAAFGAGLQTTPSPWHLIAPAQRPQKAVETEGWLPIIGGGLTGFLLGFFLFSAKSPLAPDPATTVRPDLDFHLKEAMVRHPKRPNPSESEPIRVPELAASAIPLQAIKEPTPSSEQPISVGTLYQEWVLVAEALYADPQPMLPADWSGQVEGLLKKTVPVLTPVCDLLLRQLAKYGGQESLSGHVAHLVLLSVVWCIHEGFPEEETRTLVWAALVHDLALRPLSAGQALRAHPSRSQASAALLSWIPGLDPALRFFLGLVLMRLGAKRGMLPALTVEEEKAGPLARLLTRLDRQEKILRRRTLMLAKRGMLAKAS